MAEPSADPVSAHFDDDYQVIRLSISWGALSILAFVAILVLQLFSRHLGISLPQMIGATALLGLGGFAIGLVGLRFGRAPGAARVGVFLNGAVLGIFLLVPIVSGILRRLF